MRLCAGISLSALVLALGAGGSAKAESNDPEVKALRAQVEQLTRTVNKLMEAQAENAADAKAAKKQASQAEAQAAQAKATAADAHAKSHKAPAIAGLGDIDSNGHRFLEKKPGKDLTFYTPGGQITAYGQFDVSLDGATKNAKSGPFDADGNGPVGNFGWMADISTNISYLGVRGFQHLPMHDFNFVYQFEAGIDISVTPGLKQDNSKLSNQANGALFSRNSYIGHRRNGVPSKSARLMRPTRTRRRRSTRSSARGAITRLLWAIPAATIASNSAPVYPMRSGTNRRLSAAFSSMCCGRRVRLAIMTAAIFPQVSPTVPATTIRPVVEIHSYRVATARSTMR
jgi:hypothetical protein